MTSPEKSATPTVGAVPDQLAPLRAAVRYGLVGLIALTVISAIIATSLAGLPGLWGTLIGAAVGGGFILCTVVVVLSTAHSNPGTAGAVLLGSWLAKIIVAIVVMVAIKGMTFYDKYALVGTIIAAIVVLLSAETYAILKLRVPYVDPMPESGQNDKK
ncbi:hypothetical protein G4X40_22110 [Rhodococcus sp. D2-41]|uniref:ATP synthase protein I n=1 Tax=Speluncibacter jeojiensis TaxID=2710754 RepID=A0A9X4RG77_9ACTN|nr:hypothetical protein [Rhodococcus sp. D2-41]MDG3012838.1 hypothetical protein [Rhodococcus sp. D2-41]MDG3017047.1 hypothetical protein [Corynebacteriales bacterium D3-21]